MKKNNNPKKIYVELTTRCNLHCRMCVKNMDGSCIPEEDMPLAVFDHLLPALTYADNLILNGIGEPLLYPNLLKIIRFARLRLPATASIGFQSNGVLLNKNFYQELIEAGLNTVCLSVDDMRDCTSKNRHSSGEHSFYAVQKAVLCLARARAKTGRDLKIGLEIVLNQKNIEELPALVNWAADNNVDYIITTHLIQYGNTSESVNLFNPNSSDAVQLFNKYNQRASSQGIDIAKTREIDLFLPPLQAQNQISCVFITDEATFIASNGDVMSCHFLWHTYSCQMLDETININRRAFGNISEQSLGEIWQDSTIILPAGVAPKALVRRM